MNVPKPASHALRAPHLSRTRMILALGVAVLADGIQFVLGQLGWMFADEIIDVAAMILVSWLIGFHLLFLPTFVVEFIPVADMLPTWTGCVALVLVWRKKEQTATSPPPPPPYIDV